MAANRHGHAGRSNPIRRAPRAFPVFSVALLLATGTLATADADNSVPDLHIVDSADDITTSPANPRAGEEFDVYCRVYNGAGHATSPSFEVAATIEGVTEKVTTPGLAGGRNRNVKISFDQTFDAGQHGVKCHVDPDRKVSDDFRGNNALTRTITWGAASPPDLKISSVSITPDPPTSMEDFTAKCKVENDGDGSTVVDFDVTLYIDGDFKFRETIGPLGGGQSRTVEMSRRDVPAGSHSIKCVVDSGSDVAEDRENNNERTSSFTWQGPSLPNLEPTDVDTNPSPPKADQPVEVTCKVKNDGQADASAFTVAAKIGETQETTRDSNGLDKGATGSYAFSFDALPEGQRSVRCIADVDAEIDENNENDNSESWLRTWMPADAPPPPANGEPDCDATSHPTGVVGEELRFHAACHDPDGLSRVEWTVTGAATRSWNDELPTTPQTLTSVYATTFDSAGTYRVEARGVDAGGLRGPPARWDISISAPTAPASPPSPSTPPSTSAPPDIVIDSITTDPASPTSGGDVYVVCNFRNAGGTATQGTIPIRITIGSEVKHASFTSALQPNEPRSVKVPFFGITAGTHHIVCELNYDSSVAEANVPNSSLSADIAWGTPSRLPTSADVIFSKTTASVGDEVEVTVALTAEGTALPGRILTVSLTKPDGSHERLPAGATGADGVTKAAFAANAPGFFQVSVEFAGDSTYHPSSKANGISVELPPAKVTSTDELRRAVVIEFVPNGVPVTGQFNHGMLVVTNVGHDNLRDLALGSSDPNFAIAAPTQYPVAGAPHRVHSAEIRSGESAHVSVEFRGGEGRNTYQYSLYSGGAAVGFSTSVSIETSPVILYGDAADRGIALDFEKAFHDGTKAKFDIEPASNQPRDRPMIIIGRPGTNPILDSIVQWDQLSEDGHFVVKWDVAGYPVVLVGAKRIENLELATAELKKEAEQLYGAGGLRNFAWKSLLPGYYCVAHTDASRCAIDVAGGVLDITGAGILAHGALLLGGVAVETARDSAARDREVESGRSSQSFAVAVGLWLQKSGSTPEQPSGLPWDADRSYKDFFRGYPSDKTAAIVGEGADTQIFQRYENDLRKSAEKFGVPYDDWRSRYQLFLADLGPGATLGTRELHYIKHCVVLVVVEPWCSDLYAKHGRQPRVLMGALDKRVVELLEPGSNFGGVGRDLPHLQVFEESTVEGGKPVKSLIVVKHDGKQAVTAHFTDTPNGIQLRSFHEVENVEKAARGLTLDASGKLVASRTAAKAGLRIVDVTTDWTWRLIRSV